jgi:hypothetical protein
MVFGTWYIILIGSGWSKLKPEFAGQQDRSRCLCPSTKIQRCTKSSEAALRTMIAIQVHLKKVSKQCHAEGSHIHTYHFFESMLIIMQLIVT